MMVLWLGIPKHSFAAIATLSGAHLQFGGTGTATSGTSINTTGASLIVVHIGATAFTLGTITITDSRGNTYATLTSQSSTGGVKAFSQIVYISAPLTSATHTFTATVGGSPFVLNYSIEVQAYTGSLTSGSPFDVQNGTTNTVATIQPGSVTPTQAGSLVVSGYGGTTAAPAASIDSSFTITDSLSGGPKSALAYIVQGAAAAVNPTWSSNNGSGDEAAVIAVFKPAAVTPTTTSISPRLSVFRRLFVIGRLIF